MKRTSFIGIVLLLGTAALSACGDDVAATTETETEDESGTSTPDPTTTSMSLTTMTDSSTSGVDSTSSSTSMGPTTDAESSTTDDPPPPPMEATFRVTIENVSDTGLMFSPLSPGVWANHEPNADTLFTNNAPDDGEGLEALAEDGDPTDLAAAVLDHADVLQGGVFDTPVGGMPGPLLPGDMYEFEFLAQPSTRLALATMIVGSNDLVIASGPAGVSLFSGGGQPIGERDVSASLAIWDAGTEANQAPGQGPFQAQYGGSPDIGPPELDQNVHPHAYSTRAIPLGPDLVSIDVEQDMKDPTLYHIAITNISGDRGTLVTPFSALVWATHDDTVSLFAEGAPASPELEALAEDGDATPYEMLLTGAAGVGASGVIPGPIAPGETVQIDITPAAGTPRFSLATMVVESNDAFLAMGPAGVALYDEAGVVRSTNDMEDAINAELTPWDAGTEANEVPGAGLNQVLRQMMPNTGPADMNPDVRRYSDVTNDLMGPSLGGFLDVTVADAMMGGYTITVTNTSDTIAFTGVATPTVWAIHDDTVSLFEPGMPASPGFEAMAEDGDPSVLAGEVMGVGGISSFGIADTPIMAGVPGPLLPGDSYEFTVMPDGTNRFLSFATMVVPSNDTFAATDPAGVEMYTAMGMPRPAADIQMDIAAALTAWDAGTEGNQAGAAGADMAPVGAPNSGPSNGNGVVRQGDEDEIWSVPEPQNLIRVIVAPVE